MVKFRSGGSELGFEAGKDHLRRIATGAERGAADDGAFVEEILDAADQLDFIGELIVGSEIENE